MKVWLSRKALAGEDAERQLAEIEKQTQVVAQLYAEVDYLQRAYNRKSERSLTLARRLQNGNFVSTELDRLKSDLAVLNGELQAQEPSLLAKQKEYADARSKLAQMSKTFQDSYVELNVGYDVASSAKA